jgi:hypothetical protein
MKIVFYIFALGFSFNVFAGNGTSGGGGAFVCRDNEKNILSSYLLDLWEAQKINNQEIVFSNVSSEEQINNAIEKLNKVDSYLASETAQQVELIFNSARYLPDDISLPAPAPADANSKYQKKDCPLEGMMFYDGDLDQLQIVPSVFNKLATNTDIAAAKLHEALYYVFRNNTIENVQSNISTSIPIRNLVGCLFSRNDDCLISNFSKNNILSNSDSAYLCESPNFSFYLLKKNAYIESSFQSVGFPGTTKDWIGMLDQYLGLEVKSLTFFDVGEPGLNSSYTPNTMTKYHYTLIPFLFEKSKDSDLIDGHPRLSKFRLFITFPGDESKFENPICRKLK